MFLKILGQVVIRFNWLCHAYCLMGNHYHLLIETPEGNLSAGMRQLNGVYTQAFNRAHRRDGHILRGRFAAVLVEKESHLLELCRYVPERCVRQSRQEQYWSSYLPRPQGSKAGITDDRMAPREFFDRPTGVPSAVPAIRERGWTERIPREKLSGRFSRGRKPSSVRRRNFFVSRR
jgi:REP element-mobilizing transposase RayT